jgi:hypothetical protein
MARTLTVTARSLGQTLAENGTMRAIRLLAGARMMFGGGLVSFVDRDRTGFPPKAVWSATIRDEDAPKVLLAEPVVFRELVLVHCPHGVQIEVDIEE